MPSQTMGRSTSSRQSQCGMLVILSAAMILAIRMAWSHLLFSPARHESPSRETVDLSEDGSISQDPNVITDIDMAHRLGLSHRGVWIFVVDETTSVLFMRRAETTMTCPGTWSIVGEHTHFNETWEEAALRGLDEELRLKPEQVSLRQVGPPQLLHLEYHKRNRVDNQWTAEFVARVRRRDVQVDQAENTIWEWIPLLKAPSWIQSCPDGKCRSCQDAHNLTRRRDGELVRLSGGVGGLVIDTLETEILPRANDLIPPPSTPE